MPKKRRLKRSEKLLLSACALLLVTVVTGFLWKDYKKRVGAAREKIARLEGDRAANTAAAADLAFWGRRDAWVEERMPVMGDSGQAQSAILEMLQKTAREREIALRTFSLAKPDGGAHHRELAVTVTANGPDEAVYRWLADLQSPEKFQAIKQLVLTTDADNVPEPEMNCTLTLARWFKK